MGERRADPATEMALVERETVQEIAAMRLQLARRGNGQEGQPAPESNDAA